MLSRAYPQLARALIALIVSLTASNVPASTAVAEPTVHSLRAAAGEKLLIGPLSERFDVSIASVREALFRLVADGLVRAEDQRGFRVRRFRIELDGLSQRLFRFPKIAGGQSRFASVVGGPELGGF